MTRPTITYVDDEPSGLATMVGGLIEANLHHDLARRDLLKPAVIGLAARDAEVGITLALLPDTVRISNGSPNGRAHLQIVTDAASLIELAATPLRFGLPDVFRAEGRVVARKVLRGRIRIRGMIRHPVRLARLSKLLSVM